MFRTRALSGSAQLLGMALDRRRFGRALFVAPQEAGLPVVFAGGFERLDVLHHDYGLWSADRGAGAVKAVFAYRWTGPWDHDLAALFLPKEKELSALLLEDLGRGLAPGTTVVVAGPKQGGIQSAGRLVEAFVGPVGARRSARHAVLLEAVVGHASGGSVPPAETEFSVEASGRRFPVVSVPGVFSHGRLDAGTAFLLSHWEPGDFRRALDWGCGSGILGVALQLAKGHSAVDLVDVDAAAVEAARLTLARNGLDPGRVRAADGFTGVEGRYDLIVSNPPFHRGLRADRAAGEGFVAEAREHLLPGGRLVLVTNAFVHYFSLLEAAFPHVRVVAEDIRYRVVEARAG